MSKKTIDPFSSATDSPAPVNFDMKIDPETLDAFDQWLALKNREADAAADRAHAERIKAGAEADAAAEDRRDAARKREIAAVVERAEADAKAEAIRRASQREDAKLHHEQALLDIELRRARSVAEAESAKRMAEVFWPMAEALGKGFATLIRIESSILREELRLIAGRNPDTGASPADNLAPVLASTISSLAASRLRTDSHFAPSGRYGDDYDDEGDDYEFEPECKGKVCKRCGGDDEDDK